MNCEVCGETDSMPYSCSRCGNSYCVSHRLPESHECTGLAVNKAHREMLRAEGEEIPWFEGESGKSVNQDNQTELWPYMIPVVFIVLLATIGAGYLALSFLLGIL